MTLFSLIDRLFSYSGRSQSIKTLSRMQLIDEWQGHLHRHFICIHVAGTNGKGSVSKKIAQALRAAHFNVGLYTSPHITSFRERIEVNGVEIPEEFVENYLPQLFDFIDQKNITPTFFELLTALSFAYFASQKVDFAVLEVGLGGEFDATNIVMPQLSVITSISYDHMEILGTHLNDIARAKAGIIKKNVPVIIGPHARFSPIIDAAKDQAVFVPEALGYYDDENSLIARFALEKLKIPEAAILLGLKHRPPCRFEVIDPRPVILDVAHNMDGFIHLRKALDVHYPHLSFNVVLALGKEKDPVMFLEHVGPLARKIYCISNDHHRLTTAKELCTQLQMRGYTNAEVVSSIDEVMKQPDPILVCGSFFIMSDVKKYFESRKELGS